MEEFLPAHMRAASQPGPAYAYGQHYPQQQQQPSRAVSIRSSNYAAAAHQFVDDEAMEGDDDDEA